MIKIQLCLENLPDTSLSSSDLETTIKDLVAHAFEQLGEHNLAELNFELSIEKYDKK